MFDRVLIANRGEIARRVIRTCRRLGVESVAVFSDADLHAPFVREADRALRIGAAPARDSYLSVSAIIEAAKRSGAQAVHPGYGFLSENPELPRACAAQGLAFIGPPASVVERMGSKIEAKLLAAAAGVPVIPGFEDDDGDDGRLVAGALAVGFPLLVKASAGGGGKGMRLVLHADELPTAVAVCRREAVSAFGDGRLLLERFVHRARHIEVQVAADDYGSVVHLFDRDCSMQRKNQKVFEEAPAPGLAEDVRGRLFGDAVRLAASIGYRNLGTMEFLFDVTTGEHFFLEMNTRLQVEHTVTEQITGLDLVEWQLRIAAGEPLPSSQETLVARGHAIEARLMAERPDADYMPSAGSILLWQAPSDDHIRIDSGVETGSEVPVHYDSMIAKVIATGPDRDQARLRLIQALGDLVILGPETNRAFLVDAARQGPFATASATTASLGELFLEGWKRPSMEPGAASHLAAALSLAWRTTALVDQSSPWSGLTGFRLPCGAGRDANHSFLVSIRGEDREAFASAVGDRFYAGRGREAPVSQVECRDGVLRFRYGEAGERGIATVRGDDLLIRMGSVEYVATTRLLADAAVGGGAAEAADTDELLAGMPGIIAELNVAPGQVVAKGDPLLTLESMKLFMILSASRDATVSEVHVNAGDTVAAGERLISFLRIESDPTVAANEGAS